MTMAAAARPECQKGSARTKVYRGKRKHKKYAEKDAAECKRVCRRFNGWGWVVGSPRRDGLGEEEESERWPL